MRKYLVSFRRCEKLESFEENGKRYVGPVFKEHLLKEVELDLEKLNKDKVDIIAEVEAQTGEMVFGSLKVFNPNTRKCLLNFKY